MSVERLEPPDARPDPARHMREHPDGFLAAVDASSIGTAITDVSGRYVLVNRALADLLGRSQCELIGVHAWSLSHPEDRDATHGLMAQLVTGAERSHREEKRYVRPDGNSVWTIVTRTIVPDEHGDPRYVLVQVEDIGDRKEAEEALRRSEQRFAALVENAADMISVLDRDGSVLYANPAAIRTLGHASSAASGETIFDFVHPDDRPAVEEAFGRRLRGAGTTSSLQLRMATDEGAWMDIEAVATNLIADPAVGGVVVNSRDVTARARAEAQVSAQARILELIARGAPLPHTLERLVFMVEELLPGSSCSMLLMQDGVLRVGAAPSLPEEYNAAIDGLVPGPDAGPCGAAVHSRSSVVVGDVTSDPRWAAHREVALRNGLRACWSMPVLSSDDSAVLGTFAIYYAEVRTPEPAHWDVVELSASLARIAIERAESERRLTHQAVHDPLTGLPNRTLFFDRLDVAISRVERQHHAVGVFLLDLDRFKVVNDSMGHAAGDELLRAVGRRLGEPLRPGDTVARFGGDEFLILCDTLNGPIDAVGVADRIAEALMMPFHVLGQEVFVTASIGIAVATSASQDPQSLIRDADVAMYRAKAAGKNRWELADERVRAKAAGRLATENALRRAVDRGELELWYQPMVSLDDGAVGGVEALLRWNHPDRGLLEPADFLGLAEDSGLIIPLGNWVIAEAARQAAAWHASGLDQLLPVSVNLSGQQILRGDACDVLARALRDAGGPRGALAIEITESVLMDDARAAIRLADTAGSLGVELWIDDFGTGYSSLSYLRRFPVHGLKIDRSFIAPLGVDPDEKPFVAAILSLAQTLGLAVIAEGVETEAQVSELRALGCPLAQGHLIGRPVPARDITAWVTTWAGFGGMPPRALTSAGPPRLHAPFGVEKPG